MGEDCVFDRPILCIPCFLENFQAMYPRWRLFTHAPNSFNESYFVYERFGDLIGVASPRKHIHCQLPQGRVMLAKRD